MGYDKTILCLANSRRQQGRCIAGKEVVANGYGEWIRPVSAGDTDETSEEERRYEDGQDPTILDIIRIPMLEHSPRTYQSENHVIDDQYYWERIGQAGWDDAIDALDKVPGPLWHNGESTWHGSNDKVPEAIADQLSSSLCLIRPEGTMVHVAREGGDFGPRRRRVRASFILNGFHYNFVVTDPIIERQYLAQQDGLYPVEYAILCLSLSGLFYAQ